MAADLAATVGQRVVRLPTAARRKVQQFHNKYSRAERARLRAESPWPGEYIYPGIRAQMPLAEAIVSAEGNPILMQAVELLVTSECPTIGDQVDLGAALKRLRE